MPLRFSAGAAEAYRFPLTIGHLLDSALITAGSQEIVYRNQRRLSYRQFRDRVGRLASLLRSVGAEEGSTVAVMDWDSHRYLEAYFALPMMGAVLLTVNVRLSAAQVAYTLAHAKAEILFVHSDFVALLDRILPELPDVQRIVVMRDSANEALPAFALGDYDELLDAASPGFCFQELDENAVATTFYTTGTTGAPKGVTFTHRQLVLHTLVCCGALASTGQGLGINDVYMPLTPMFHVHAWGVPYVATLLGVKQVYPGRYDPDLIIKLRNTEGVSFSHCVPTILQMVLAAADRAGADLTGWKMTIGGSALTTALYEQASQRGMLIAAGYGMSETGPTISIARRRRDPVSGALSDEATALTRAGIPLPLVSVKVIDETMREVPADGLTSGELVVRAPWLTPEYVHDREASETLWRGGWLHTQDIGTIDVDGHLTIKDRMKDVIKSGGEWISSLSVEDLLVSVDGVEKVAVIGVPDARWGERPIGIVVPGPGAQISLSELNSVIDAAIARGELSRFAKLERVEVTDRLPLTSVGKVDKKQLRLQFPR